MDREAKADDGTEHRRDGRSERRRVLVVDDEVLVRNLIRHILERDGYDVETTGDAFGAVQSLTLEDRPDAVICDIHMPGLDGVSLLRLLRRGEEQIPFLLISGDSSGRERAMELPDAPAFLTKPFAPDELLIAVRALLEK